MKPKILTSFSTAVLILAVTLPAHVQGYTNERLNLTPANPVTASATTGSAQKNFDVEDEKRIVQESSRRIVELVRRRPATITPDEDQRLVQEDIDIKIEEILRERAQALEAVVLADNPQIRSIDRERRFYRVPVKDGQGQVHWFSARIPAIWHLHRLDPAVFTLAESIGARSQSVNLPPDTKVTNHLLVGGTSAQSMVHPYPGDIDYNEAFTVHAPTPAAAGEAMAAIIAEYVSRIATDPKLEFDALRVMPLKARRTPGTNYRWSRERILDPAQRSELARQLTSLESGRVNTDWRALVAGGRYIVIGKIFGINALSSVSGERFFTTEPMRLDFHVLYFGDEAPAVHWVSPLGDYASIMMTRAKLRVSRKHHLKAAIAIEANLPVVPGTIPERPKAVAQQLRDIAAAIHPRDTDPVGVIAPDANLAKGMKTLLDVELILIVRLSLKDRVEKIVDTFVR